MPTAVMSADMVTWLAALMLQAALLAKSFYTMISLTDLQNDHINPFDCAERVNRFMLAEYSCQALLTAVLLVMGKWLTAALHVALLAYLVHLYMKKQVHMDAADAFRQVATFKKRHFAIFVAYCTSFLVIVFSLIRSFLDTLTPEGRVTAQKLFREAASSAHMGY